MPPSLAGAADGYRWSRNLVGESGCSVYRLHGKPGHPDRYLKHGRGRHADDVTDEMARLRWLAAHIAVPAVLHFERSEEDAWLFTEEVEGRTLYQLLEAGTDPEILVDAAAVFLRQLHAIPAESCPFASDHRLRLLAAHERMSEGLVDSGDFDEEREGLTPEAVWAQMNALLPLISDSVVTHGDFSLDNLIWRDGGIVACIDVGRAGLADRYQDLAILWNGLGEFGPAMQRRLFEAYGIEAVDRARLDFHLMLDEFF